VQVRRGESFAGSPEYELTVLAFEYLPRRDGFFGRPGHDNSMAGSGAEVTPTDLAAARTALGGKVALWAGPELDGKAIGALALLDVEVDSANGRPIRGQALELTYGAGGFGPRAANPLSSRRSVPTIPRGVTSRRQGRPHQDSPICNLGWRAAARIGSAAGRHR
jgi:hypothetical protein